MRSFFVMILLSMFGQAHPDDSIDKLGDKLAFTLSKSVEKLGQTMAHSVDKLGDTLADNLSDKLASRAFIMQSPGHLENTVHAKPVARPQAGHMGFKSASLKATSLRAPLAATRPLEHESKTTVGQVNLQDLYNPVHTGAEAAALAGAGFGHHVRRPAPVTGEREIESPGEQQEDRIAEQGGATGYLLPEKYPQRPLKFSTDASESVPRAYKYTHPELVTGEHKIKSPGQRQEYRTAEQEGATGYLLPEKYPRRRSKFSADAPESVPRAYKYTHPELFKQAPQDPFNFSPLAAEFSAASAEFAPSQ